MLYYKKLLTSFMFLLIFIVSSIYSSAKPYSINKNFESLGETRNIFELTLSRNRIELKDKIEQTIFESSVRNYTLKFLADITWSFQKNSDTFDYQFFNTDIYFGKKGEVFPKYSNCKLYDFDNINIKKPNKTEYLFLLLPLKQEIQKTQIHNYQQKYSLCDNYKNFELFENKFSNNNIHTINIYSLFSDKNQRYYESGDTHWNDFGVKKVFSKILNITHNAKNISIEQSGSKNENNLVLKRLALIDQETIQKQFELDFDTNEKKSILIIHDSFFEESYVSKSFLQNYFDPEYLNWNSLLGIDNSEFYNISNNYDFIIFESSIDTFFEERILFFTK